MFSRIYLVRHAETESNRLGLFGDGALDSRFSDLGKRQLYATRNFFKNRVTFEKIFTGLQLRQQITATSILHNITEKDLETDKRLNEMPVGE